MPGSRLLKSLFLPPSGCLLVAGFGWAVAFFGGAAWGLWLAGVGLGSLAVLSMPLVAKGLLGCLDRYPALSPEGALPPADAIVVLDGGGRLGAREYGGATVRNQTLERLRYGAFLGRRCDLPIMVSGNGAGLRMGNVLEEAFGVSPRWSEETSRNTWENASESAVILLPEGIRRILLVTHFWHMPRAVRAFRRVGFEVVPAPMGFRPGAAASGFSLRGLVPGVRAMTSGYFFCHEMIGLVWYRLRYGSARKDRLGRASSEGQSRKDGLGKTVSEGQSRKASLGRPASRVRPVRAEVDPDHRPTP